jgi:hypothetical protein
MSSSFCQRWRAELDSRRGEDFRGKAEGSGDQGVIMRDVAERIVKIWHENWLFVLILGGIIAAFLVLQTSASPLGSVAEAEALLQSGQPTLLEFYSNT